MSCKSVYHDHGSIHILKSQIWLADVRRQEEFPDRGVDFTSCSVRHQQQHPLLPMHPFPRPAQLTYPAIFMIAFTQKCSVQCGVTFPVKLPLIPRHRSQRSTMNKPSHGRIETYLHPIYLIKLGQNFCQFVSVFELKHLEVLMLKNLSPRSRSIQSRLAMIGQDAE